MRRPSMRAFWKLVLLVPLAAVAAVALLCASLWVEHNWSLKLPSPSGPFAVGRVTAAWVDPSRVDPFAPAPAPKRELVVWIWYPSQPANGARTADYFPAPLRNALAAHGGVAVNQLFNRDPAKVHGHSLEGSPMSPAKAKYPVVIFNSGIGALALQYSTLLEDLASHGYIIVGSDRPYSTTVVVMPDGRVIHRTAAGNPGDGRVASAQADRALEIVTDVWTRDTRFLLDELVRLNENDPSGRLTGRIDLAHVGVAGHSIGGAAAAQFCHDDTRCQAGIDLDGALHGSVIADGITQPFLFLLSDHRREWDSAACSICADIRSAAKPAPSDKLIVTLFDAHHFSFGDPALTQSRILRSTLLRLSGQGRLNARTGLESSARYVREFFDVHLRGNARHALYSAPLVAGARFEKP